MVVGLISSVFASGLAASGNDGGEYSFSLNGKNIEPRHQSLRSLGIDRDGILVHLDDLVLVIDRKGSHDFHGDPDKNGLLFEFVAGEKQLVGIKTGRHYGQGAENRLTPFSGLRPEDMKHVRGVYLDDELSSKGLALLRHIVPEKVFVVVTDKTASGEDRAFPPIPTTVHYLSLDERSSEGIQDYAALKSFESLVYLRFHALFGPGVDLSLIGGNARLAYLDLSGQMLHNVEALGSLTELRQLNLEHSSGLTNISFVGRLGKLQRLRINNTQVTDLTPIQHLESLEYVNANSSQVQKLPHARVNSLTALKVMDTALSKEAVAGFRESNPGCKVTHDWNETFQGAVAGVDRIRVRSGGTCGYDPENERTLFEITDPAEVAATIALIKVEPTESGFHCMCCGEPSFEFYRGDALTATFGFHHGRSLRWSGGEWPGDGLLTHDSADSLCELLAEHGVPGPLEERNETTRQEAALARRWSLYAEILPVGVASRMMDAKTEEDLANAFIKGERDKDERVKIVLRVAGCDHGSWNLFNGLDAVVLALLDNRLPSTFPGIAGGVEIEAKDEWIATDDIVAAVRTNENDAMLVRGAARWLLGEEKYAELADNQMEELLPVLAEAALTSPRQINRRRTLLALKRIKSEAAVTILRGVLSGKYQAITLSDEENVEPGGMVVSRPGDSEVDDACSDQAYAAWILAELGRSEALGRIRQLLETETQVESKKVLKKAVRLLD
jgi:hypothetical protein